MHDDIPWQVFLPNGEPDPGNGRLRSEFAMQDAPICGSAHVWLVRRTISGKREVLLQKRSMSIEAWPGYYDISAAGHIDLGETPLSAAVRESKEEIGIDVDTDRLELLFVNKKLPNKFGDASSGFTEFQWVYRCNISNDQNFVLIDGEAERLEWFAFDDLSRTDIRKTKPLVPHSDEYFAMLTSRL